MSSTALALLAALCLPQDPEPPRDPARVAVLGRVLRRDGSLDLARLGLGDGGVAAERARPGSGGDGRFRTSGGVEVRALAEGVKVDFPSGGELLIDSRGRVHLRDGSRTLPSSAGVRVALLDGAVVEALPQNGSDLPLRQVSVVDGRSRAQLWKAGRPVRRQDRSGVFPGRTLHAFDDGRVLYEVSDVGVAIVLDRALCPKDREEDQPVVMVAILGDLLARSLREIGEIAQQRAAGDLRTQQMANALASNAGRMFARSHERPAGARGELLVPLEASFRLRLSVPSVGPIALSLLGRDGDVPLCEWTTTNVTRLHLVQRDAGPEGSARYLMRGYALNHLLESVLDFEPSPTARARARRALTELSAVGGPGVGAVQLPVERRN